MAKAGPTLVHTWFQCGKFKDRQDCSVRNPRWYLFLGRKETILDIGEPKTYKHGLFPQESQTQRDDVHKNALSWKYINCYIFFILSNNILVNWYIKLNNLTLKGFLWRLVNQANNVLLDETHHMGQRLCFHQESMADGME